MFKNTFFKACSYYRRRINYINVITLVLSITVLIATSIYVGHKSSVIHSFNQDNLADSFMFESRDSFKNAYFPGDHTFLLKWPIFALMAIAGNSATVFQITNIAIYLVTVLGIALLLYYLCKRDITSTSLSILIFSSVLLLTPAQPIDTFPSPVNLAMLTTRNLEIIVYVIIVYLFTQMRHIRTRVFATASALIALLSASDNLFIFVLILSSLFKLCLDMIRKISGTSKYLPLISTVIGMVTGQVVIHLINLLHFTHILPPGAPTIFSPSIQDMFGNALSTIQALLINFGANIFNKALSIDTLPYLVNFFAFVAALVIGYVYFCKPVVNKKLKKYDQGDEWQLTLWILIGAIISCCLTTVSTYDHIVIGRYLPICLIAGVSVISWLIGQLKKKGLIVQICIMILIGVNILGFFAARASLSSTIAANQHTYDYFNQIAEEINIEHVDILVANFWVSGPVKIRVDHPLIIVPQASSGNAGYTPERRLTSELWFKSADNAKSNSAIYIVGGYASNLTYSALCQIEALCKYPNTPTTSVPTSDIENLTGKYGMPVKIIPIAREDNKLSWLYIYNYDIRIRDNK